VNIITPYNDKTKSKSDQVAYMFDSISQTYDFLNHFLSLGVDIIWRKRAVKELKKLNPQKILDVATGTGDFAFEIQKAINPKELVGVDISSGMLGIAKKKALKRGLKDKISFELANSENLPFEDNFFDAATVAYGVRNYEDLESGLNGIFKVLKPGGHLVILEFSNPKKFPIKQFYNFYLFHVLPFFGNFFSKDKRAYKYLAESVKAFPDGENFLKILNKVGFKEVNCQPLTGEICSIYIGTK
jgi:demethylmenaquinone methyltransferase/2-methoxy-6-polyprenyl-1,4-benzoquinol methylase